MTSPATTRTTSPAATRALGAALTAGILGDLLLKDSPAPGLNVLLLVLGILALARFVRSATPDAPAGQGRWLLVAAGFATCLVIRDAELLQAWNILAILIAFTLAALPWFAPHQQRARDIDVIRTGFYAFFSFWTGTALLGSEADWSRLFGRGGTRARGIALGLLLALPIVLVLGSLFSAADPAFAALMQSLFDWNLGPVLGHVVLTGFLAWVTAGFLRAWSWKPGAWISMKPVPDSFQPQLTATTIGIVLGAMGAMFTLFIALQARYLFGGEATIISIAGLGYADYARNGFFEMVAATALVIPVLYVADLLKPRDNPRAVQSLRALGGAQLALTLAVAASAFLRMALYIGAYGLTEDRIAATAILAWLASLVVIFANTVLRGRRDRFPYAAIVAGFVTLGGLNAVNPDAQIARVNIQRAAEGKEIDAEHLGRLGADAVPAIMDARAALPATARCIVLAAVNNRWDDSTDADWRSFNVARSRARTLASGITAACIP